MLKAAVLEDKLKYWHGEVNNSIETRFLEQNQSWYESLKQLQLDVST